MRSRAFVWQAAALIAVAAILAAVSLQTAANLKARGIASGFGYLGRAAGFEIAPGPLRYSSRDTYARALAIGVCNTARVSLAGGLFAAALGVSIAVARLSRIEMVSTAAAAYVEIVRNTPLLLQLLVWYSLSQSLPGTHDALHPLPGVFLSSRGLFLPWIRWRGGSLFIEYPAAGAFDFHGGLSISPEFLALLAGLSTYTAAFLGEIIRGGLVAVDQGQIEAAAALGLSRARALQLVVMPQALPMIVPPAVSQFLNLLKNSSLAVAIGYPDLISITNTTLNQTGQAVEAIAVAMGVYLAISVTVSWAFNSHRAAAAAAPADL